MTNKVFFNFDELFISVGMDVGADFSWMSIALPNQTFVGKPFKILHDSISSLELAVSSSVSRFTYVLFANMMKKLPLFWKTCMNWLIPTKGLNLYNRYT